MAALESRPKIDLEISLKINEAEARALDALVGYSFDDFIKVFKEGLGRHYMENNEEGLRTFFKDIRQIMPGILYQVDKARKEFQK